MQRAHVRLGQAIEPLRRRIQRCAGTANLNAPCNDEGGRARDSRSGAASRRDPLGPGHLQNAAGFSQ
jgi:hypothetical protein